MCPGGSGSFTTQTYDLFQSSALPGAVMVLGTCTTPNLCSSPSVQVSTYYAVDASYFVRGILPNPLPIKAISPTGALFNAEVDVISDGGTISAFSGPVGPGIIPPARVIPVGRQVQFKLSVTSLITGDSVDPLYCAGVDPNNPASCQYPMDVVPYVNDSAEAACTGLQPDYPAVPVTASSSTSARIKAPSSPTRYPSRT